LNRKFEDQVLGPENHRNFLNLGPPPRRETRRSAALPGPPTRLELPGRRAQPRNWTCSPHAKRPGMFTCFSSASPPESLRCWSGGNHRDRRHRLGPWRSDKSRHGTRSAWPWCATRSVPASSPSQNSTANRADLGVAPQYQNGHPATDGLRLDGYVVEGEVVVGVVDNSVLREGPGRRISRI